MATLILTDGTERYVHPAGADGLTLDELYKLLGCSTVETIALRDGRTMILDEDGKATDKPVNVRATRLAYRAGIASDDYVVGDVLVCVGDGEGNLRRRRSKVASRRPPVEVKSGDWLMDAMWGSFVGWAWSEPKMRAAFTKDTGIVLSGSTARSPLDAMIDTATGRADHEAHEFVKWVTREHWGMDYAPAAFRAACGVGGGA